MNPRFIYIFLDESGDFNFSPKGSKYFFLTSLTKERPFDAFRGLHNLRYDLMEQGVAVPDYFHATEDKQDVRNKVYSIIQAHLTGTRIDALIVEKAKAGPALRALEEFYPRMLGYLIKHVVRGYRSSPEAHFMIVLANLYTGAQKRAVEKAVKQMLTKMLPAGLTYNIIYQSAKANMDVQITDYCTWAIFKKWSSGETRPYEMIKAAVRSEFDIFQLGSTFYY